MVFLKSKQYLQEIIQRGKKLIIKVVTNDAR